MVATDFSFWGHNCFLVETAHEALLIDPWLNDTGAFFGSWHQWPPNGHLRDAVLERCAGKKLSIFLSHEHQDHFDKSTLSRFAGHPDCTVFLPAYQDKFLLAALREMNLRTAELEDGAQAGEQIRFRVFIDDGGINHDASIFVKTPTLTFFNQNDCKVFDRLPMLKEELGEIDYYSVQFSGANWHPACFELPDDQRRSLSKKKVLSKFRNVLTGLKVLAPRFFLPAAGPAFFPFLDPALNAGSGTIFVHQDDVAKFLVQKTESTMLYPRPGEAITEDTNRIPIPGPSMEDIERYRASHLDVWEGIGDTFSPQRFSEVLQHRLDLIAQLVIPSDTPSIAFNWGPADTDWLLVDLVAKTLSRSPTPSPPYLVLAAGTRYFSLMCGDDRWQDIALSMRASIQRVPDVYNTIVNIFLFADASNLAESVERQLNLSKERIVIRHLGQRYEINRYCPHQGGDLAYASVDDDGHVVCPRHSWRFDLQCEGMCKSSGTSIDAVKLEG